MVYGKKLLLSGIAIIFYATALVGVTTGPQLPNPAMQGGMINQGFPSGQPPYNPMNINQEGTNINEEQELNNMLNDIESYRNNLSKEEQLKFDADVNETAARMQARMDEMIKNDPSLEDKLSKQDPEAINAFLANVFQPELERAEAEQAAQQPPTLPAEVGPSAPIEMGPSIPEKAEEKPEKLKKADIKGALGLIHSIVEFLESFKEKTTAIIKFAGYYEKWAKEGRLKGWTRELTWEKFSEKLDLLINRFKELERRDPETKEYTHLGDLIENEPLYQDVVQFTDDLAENEPRIIIPEAGIGEMNSASKDAARETINTCLYGITKLQDKITALMSKYEKTAKKISEEKEKERQKAEQAAKQRRPGYTYRIGAEEGGYPYYPEQIIGPYSPYTPWETPSTEAQKITPPTIEKKEQKKEDGKKGGGEQKGKGGEKKKSEEEAAVDKALVDLMDKIAEIGYLIDENDHLKNFGEYMSNSREDYDPSAVAALNDIQKNLKEAARTIRRTGGAWFPRLDAGTKNSAIKQFTDFITTDEQVAPLRKLISDVEKVDKARGNVTKKKQYAFFDDVTRQALEKAQTQKQQEEAETQQRAGAQRPQAAPAQPQQPANEYAGLEKTSIFTLPNDFNKLKEAIEALKKIKQKPGQKKQASEQGGHIQMIPQPQKEEAAAE